MTTAFIAEEYPEGFDGVELPVEALRKIAASAAAMHRVAEIRRTRISGRMDNHERQVGDDWAVTLQGQRFDVTVSADPGGSSVRFADGTSLRAGARERPHLLLASDGRPTHLLTGRVYDADVAPAQRASWRRLAASSAAARCSQACSSSASRGTDRKDSVRVTARRRCDTASSKPCVGAIS